MCSIDTIHVCTLYLPFISEFKSNKNYLFPAKVFLTLLLLEAVFQLANIVYYNDMPQPMQTYVFYQTMNSKPEMIFLNPFVALHNQYVYVNAYVYMYT